MLEKLENHSEKGLFSETLILELFCSLRITSRFLCGQNDAGHACCALTRVAARNPGAKLLNAYVFNLRVILRFHNLRKFEFCSFFLQALGNVSFIQLKIWTTFVINVNLLWFKIRHVYSFLEIVALYWSHKKGIRAVIVNIEWLFFFGKKGRWKGKLTYVSSYMMGRIDKFSTYPQFFQIVPEICPI